MGKSLAVSQKNCRSMFIKCKNKLFFKKKSGFDCSFISNLSSVGNRLV